MATTNEDENKPVAMPSKSDKTLIFWRHVTDCKQTDTTWNMSTSICTE